MFKFPRRLGIVESWRIPGELELLHNRLRSTLLSFQQECHVNLEFDELCSLVLIPSWSLFKQCFETLPRFGVVFILEWNLREIVLRLAELRIELGCPFEGGFGLIKLLLLHQDFAA